MRGTYEESQATEVCEPPNTQQLWQDLPALRLAESRPERRPNSKYASIENCRAEVAEAEAMMRRAGIRWLSTTTKSIEEIATTILQEVRPERLVY